MSIDKIRNIGLDKLVTQVYDFDSLTTDELMCKFTQKINIIIEHFNYLDKQCQNNNENVKLKLEYLLGQGLEEQVAKRLLELINNGTLGKLINETLLKEINEKLDNNTKYKGILLNAIEIGCDNTGTVACTDIVQSKIDEGYSILFPKGTFKCNITMKPNITIEGAGIALTDIIPEDINTNVINADKSCYEYTIKNFTIDGKNNMGTGSTTIKGIHLSNKGTLAQQDLEPHIENIKIVNCKIGLQVDEGIRGGLFKNIKSGACEIGINHLSTDCIFKDCITAQTQKHGIYVYQSNNIFINCKAFLAGLGKVIGAGIKLQGSYNRLIGCECQQNVFENLHLQNANNNIIQGMLLDGAGYNSKVDFPSLEYAEEGGNVPISSLRLFNSQGNIIDATIINGRLDSYCKCGLYNQYVGNDNSNDIRLTVKDTDTATSKPFVNYVLDDDNKYFKNNNIVINGSLMQNRTWTVPTVPSDTGTYVSGGYIVKDGICYLNMKVTATQTTTWDTTIVTGLPVPAMTEYQLASSKADKALRVENNTIIASGGTTAEATYKFSGSYLIK